VDRAAQNRRGRAYVALAAAAWSTAGVLQRELSVDVAAQLGGRALFAAVGRRSKEKIKKSYVNAGKKNKMVRLKK